MPTMPQRPGTGWVNFQRILELNKPQAQAMGQRVAKDVGGQAEKAKVGLEKAQGAFQQKMGEQKLPEAEGIMSQAVGGDKAGAYQRAGAALAQAQAGYQGPQNLGDVADTKAVGRDLNAAAGRVAGLNSTGGLATALQGLYGRTTMGGSALDAALAGAGGAQALQAVQAQYGGLGNALSRAEQQAAQQVQEAKSAYPGMEGKYNQVIAQIAAMEAEDARRAQMEARRREARGERPLPRLYTGTGETPEGGRPYGGRG